MPEISDIEQILQRLPDWLNELQKLREIILANSIMCGEFPSPTFGEEKLTRFLSDRFNESGLQHISCDEAGNATALLPGSEGKRTLLVSAHVDKVWAESIDHTVSVSTDTMRGPGIADNSIGVATLASLPEILKLLNIKLKSNLILLGTTRSMGRGDLEGLRFFIENSKYPIHSAICVEGIQLGRLSYSSLGMNRCEIEVHTAEESDWISYNSSGAVVALNRIIDRILAIETPGKPETSIILGSISAGTAYNIPPNHAILRFEVRSEQPGMVARIRERIEEIVDQINAEDKVRATLTLIARRRPGGIDFSHPLVKATRKIMAALEIKPKVAPSTGELSALADRNIPTVTLGITRGEGKHSLEESVSIKPIFKGLTQLIAVLMAMDEGFCDE
jgi:tripeptide aminopeptidase